jgi:sporulation protein YlmC with PRC-barrel domain
MKKLHPFAFYALVTPVIALSAGSVLAGEYGQDSDTEQNSTQRDQGAMQSTPKNTQSDQDTQRGGQSDSQIASPRLSANQGYISSAPANGMQASDLIGAEVKTTGNENVGPVEDLIIDQNGQIAAIVVSVGGFLGMGEKNVAIGWDQVTASRTADEQELRVNLTRGELGSAPEFKARD